MDTSRRVFRGKAGPTDRRLPKYNARRRKPPRQKSEPTSAAEAVDDVVNNRDDISRDDEEDDNFIPTVIIQEAQQPCNVSTNIIHHEQKEEATDNREDQSQEDSATIVKCQREMKHLIQRVRHVRESMSLSGKAILDSQTYEQNVLNAAANCVNEWRSILCHYPDEIVVANESSAKAASLQIFELIQQTLQCGPLAGAKPGYFKRCGGPVAKMILQFLESIIPNRDVAHSFQLTTKQADAIEKWKQNARKAIEST